METQSRPLLRLAPWAVLLVLAYAVGHWHAVPSREPESSPPGETPLPQSAGTTAPVLSPEDQLRARVDALMAAASKVMAPDAATWAFFENLSGAEAALVTAHVAQFPSGNERDVFLHAALGRWAETDAPAALVHANAVNTLPQRATARATVYEVWGKNDASAAFARALSESEESDRWRALTALLTGAAVAYPGGAITLWEGAPVAFRESFAGRNALARIVDAAHGTGQRAAVQAIVAGLPPGRERGELTVALARAWGVHDPDAAVAWLGTVAPAGPAVDSMVDEVFAVLARRDPVRAADWSTRQLDERRRTRYVGMAVAEWAIYDIVAAETWVNEQPDGSYLDAAAYAIAAQYIENRHLREGFAWTRRIVRIETRAELLGNLGRIWHEDRPEEFATFMAETSLNRAEVEMLNSKLSPPASP